MTFNNHNNHNGNGFPAGALGLPASGFGARGSRINSKRLSVALPPKVAPINENQVDNPTPRTSRSHLLAGLRTQPKTPGVPASAPYHQTHHSISGPSASPWSDQSYGGRGQAVPQTATGSTFDFPNQHAMHAARQMYALPEQVLAPPPVYEQAEEMDPSVLQQMHVTSLFLAQRQQQLQQQLANITAATGNMGLNGNMQRGSFHQNQLPLTSSAPQNFYGQQQQQVPAPIEVPGQPGVYLVYNPAIQGYSYAFDQNMQQSQQIVSPIQQSSGNHFSPARYESPTQNYNAASLPPAERLTPSNSRSFTPPKKSQTPPSALEHVEPLPPPSATAFRRGHKKASSLAIDPFGKVADGPKTSSTAVFGSQRAVFPPTPMTGTFGPGAARAGEHPVRQPRGPPPLEELTTAPTSQHEGSKNFATRQRRRALDSLMRAGTTRRGVSHSSGGSPVSERECNFSTSEAGEDRLSLASCGSRKMSPIGSEMKEKRGSPTSTDGYFALSSASSSDEDWKQPPTPATPSAYGDDRKKMMLGVLSHAEKRKTLAF
ncbi:uncharacterized protein RCC_02953 [Ramularia collo-cygni]|uniref:Uncharacterized protein n=1 Tax=Ramularia collo-cygni TaxID=112498 RepID=A0A2D3UPA6_9PEZI|nr:uncharacterized protein RCC_02953 [Ramularia collo-cygni]CZT17121.1 uncharacterized protein RCC_02953 [Ramularia collo-cygni]